MQMAYSTVDGSKVGKRSERTSLSMVWVGDRHWPLTTLQPTIFPIGGLRCRFEKNGYRFVSSCGQLLRLVSSFSSAVPDKHRLQHAEKQSHLQFQLGSYECQGPHQASVLTCDANS